MGGATHAKIERKEANAALLKNIHNSNNGAEYDRADNHLIVASIGLLAASLAIPRQSDKIFNIFLGISAFAFLVSFFVFLWHQRRTVIRRRIYKQRHEKWLEDGKLYLSKILTLTAELTTLRIKVYVYEHEEEIEKMNVDEIKDLFEKITGGTEEYSYIVEAISYLMSEDDRKNYKNSFLEPLAEKYTKTKNRIDHFTRKWRYRIFVIGILCFVVSLLSNYFL